MRIYLAGPMTGYPDNNKPLFNHWANLLRNELGLDVVNPAELDAVSGPLEELEDYYCRDLPYLCSCDAIFCLPGWNKSTGATLETGVAKALNKPVYRCVQKFDGTIELVVIDDLELPDLVYPRNRMRMVEEV